MAKRLAERKTRTNWASNQRAWKLFPALSAGWPYLLRALIGSLDCPCPMWLARGLSLMLVVRPPVKNCCMIIIPCAFRYASSLFLFLRWNQTLKPLYSVFLMRQRRNWLTGRNERINCIKSSWKWWHNGRGMLYLKIYRIRKRSQICLKGLAESKFFNLHLLKIINLMRHWQISYLFPILRKNSISPVLT